MPPRSGKRGSKKKETSSSELTTPDNMSDQKALPSPQSTPTPEVAVQDEAAGGASPSNGEPDAGVETTDQSVAEPNTPAQII